MPPASTLPATAPAGAVAIDASAFPVGGAAARAEPARLRGTRAAARAEVPQRPSRRAGRHRRRRLVAGVGFLPARTPCALSTLAPPPPLGSARTYHRSR